MVAANSYGDTVWFDSAVMMSRPIVISDGGADPPLGMAHTIARGRTRGTPVLIIAREHDPASSAQEIVERALRQPDLGMRRRIIAADSDLATIESSALAIWSRRPASDPLGRPRARPLTFGDRFVARRLENWSVNLPIGDSSAVRLLFVVIGESDSSVAPPLRQAWSESWGKTRSAGDPMPLKADRYLRPFEIPLSDRLATARIVGEFRADRKRQQIALVDLSAESRSALAARWRYARCTLGP